MSGREDIDSLAPRLNRHCLFIRHDANRTSLADIKKHPVDAGFTPTNDYTSDRMGFVLFDIAITYLKDTTSEGKLRRQIK